MTRSIVATLGRGGGATAWARSLTDASGAADLMSSSSGAFTEPTYANIGAGRSDLPSLTTVNAGPTMTSGTSGSHTVIQNTNFTDANFFGTWSYIDFVNCKFSGSSTDQLIEMHSTSGRTLTFTDCTIQQSPAVSFMGILADGVAFTRTIISGFQHQIRHPSNCTFDSCLIDANPVSEYAYTLNSDDPPHGDTIYVSYSVTANTFSNTVLMGGSSQIVFSDQTTALDGWSFDHCYFYGNKIYPSRTTYPSDPTWQTDGAFKGVFTGLSVSNSKFQHSGGSYGLNRLIADATTLSYGTPGWTGNTDMSDGTAVTAP
jgi:uncharacterized protein YjbI with pentapeptide repeats